MISSLSSDKASEVDQFRMKQSSRLFGEEKHYFWELWEKKNMSVMFEVVFVFSFVQWNNFSLEWWIVDES